VGRLRDLEAIDASDVLDNAALSQTSTRKAKYVLLFMDKSDSTRPGPLVFIPPCCCVLESDEKMVDKTEQSDRVIMTQNQIGSPERPLARNVCYGIIGTLGIAILGRDLGVGSSVLPWVLYAIFATPMIVMVSHRELFGAPPSTRWILYAMLAVPAINLLSRQTGLGG
jgi:hypothetical protein